MTRHLAVFATGLLLVLRPVPALTLAGSSDIHEAAPASAPATDPSAAVTHEELEAVTAELARLRAEVAALRDELAAARIPARSASAQPQQAAASVEMLRAQVDEMSQTKVESTSRMPVRLFGAIVSNTVGNSGMANWLENPNLADAEIAGTEPGS